MADFVSVVLGDTEDTWHDIFRQQGKAYREPTLVLFTGRVNSACGMATAIGDDRLQRDAGRQVVPDSFTHGTSAQRVKWFNAGFESGDIAACDTFSSKNS